MGGVVALKGWAGQRGRRPAPPLLPQPLTAYVGAVVAAAGVLTLVVALREGFPNAALTAGLAVSAIVLELRPVDLGSSRVSLTMVPIFTAALLLGPMGAALVAAAAALTAHAALRRPLHKVLFNAAAFVTAGIAAAYAFRVVGAPVTPEEVPSATGAALAAAAVAFFVNSALVAGAVRLSLPVRILSFWWGNYASLAPHYVVLGFMGYVLALAHESVGAVGMVAFALPVAMMWLAVHQATRRAREDLERLRRTERALRASEERYRSLVEHTSRGVFVTDGAGRVRFHNRQLEDMVRRPVQEDEPLSAFVVATEGLAEALRRATAEPQRLELQIADAAQPRLLALTLSRYGEDGGILGEAEDITERRALELRMQQAQRMESLGALAAGVSHDFNNLLTAVLVNLELAAATAPSPSPPLQSATEATRSAVELVKQLLSIGRTGPAQRGQVGLGPVVGDIASLLRRGLAPDVVVEEDVEAGLAVWGNASELKRVLLNLVVNGCEAMDGRGRLTVRARRVAAAGLPPWAAGYVLLEVVDQGSGMDSPTAARMFEPFFTTKAGRGTGLGCAVVYGLVRDHGGAISVDSLPGRGTTVRVFLPASAPAPLSSRCEGGRPAFVGPGLSALVPQDAPVLLPVHR